MFHGNLLDLKKLRDTPCILSLFNYYHYNCCLCTFCTTIPTYIFIFNNFYTCYINRTVLIAKIEPSTKNPCRLRVHKPIETVATVSTLVILCHNSTIIAYIVAFLEFLPTKQSEKCKEIACLCGICWSVMVITQQHHDPAYKPPPLFCPIMTERGGRGYLRVCYW